MRSPRSVATCQCEHAAHFPDEPATRLPAVHEYGDGGGELHEVVVEGMWSGRVCEPCLQTCLADCPGMMVDGQVSA